MWVEVGIGLERVLFGLITGVSFPVVILLSVREQSCSQHHLINAIGVEEERGGGLSRAARGSRETDGQVERPTEPGGERVNLLRRSRSESEQVTRRALTSHVPSFF